jgi:hypothetical protein
MQVVAAAVEAETSASALCHTQEVVSFRLSVGWAEQALLQALLVTTALPEAQRLWCSHDAGMAHL